MASIEGVEKYESMHRYALASQFATGKDVLDLTAGHGYGSRILARTASSVVEVRPPSIAPEDVAAAADIANLRFLQGSSGRIPLEDHSVDIVVSFESFEPQENLTDLCAEITRVLRPGGLLLVAALNKAVLPGGSGVQHERTVRAVDFGSLDGLLHQYFGHVAIYAQRANLSSFIYPFAFDSSNDGFRYTPEVDHNDSSQSSHDAAVYFFAVASDGALPTPDRIASVHSNLTVSPDGYALYALMEHLTQVYAELEASRRAIAALQGSKFWRLRDAWFGVRDRRTWLTALVPPVQKALWSLTYRRPAGGYPVPIMNSVMGTVVPPLQKVLWGLTYSHLTNRLPSPEMTFMNLGFVGGADDPKPTLEVGDEPDRLRIQLYHHVATLADVAGREVLEIGCGRGGGASYVMRYLGPSSVVGMDLADSAVEFCRRTHRIDGLRFVPGDAEKVPFESQQFDVVLNVESSHCYPSLDAFYREVKRVLRPGGKFLYVDIMPTDQLPERRKMLETAGLEIVTERDITANVLASLDSSTVQRVSFEAALTAVFGREGAREWSMLPGSQTLDGMRQGALSYVSMAVHAP